MKAVLCHHAARFRLQEVINIGFLGTLDIKIHKNVFFFFLIWHLLLGMPI